jgi:hypothetical protein
MYQSWGLDIQMIHPGLRSDILSVAILGVKVVEQTT